MEAQKIHILLEVMSCPGLVPLRAKSFPQEPAFEGSGRACEHCSYVYSRNPPLMRNCLHQLTEHLQLLKLCRFMAPKNPWCFGHGKKVFMQALSMQLRLQ